MSKRRKTMENLSKTFYKNDLKSKIDLLFLKNSIIFIYLNELPSNISDIDRKFMILVRVI